MDAINVFVIVLAPVVFVLCFLALRRWWDWRDSMLRKFIGKFRK